MRLNQASFKKLTTDTIREGKERHRGEWNKAGRVRGAGRIRRRGRLHRAARHRGDRAVRYLANPIVTSIRDVEVAGCVHSDTIRTIQLRAVGRTVVATKTRPPVSCNRGDYT